MPDILDVDVLIRSVLTPTARNSTVLFGKGDISVGSWSTKLNNVFTVTEVAITPYDKRILHVN
jgi:hypothetical protein